jgi:short-subunit dehydrogenase
MKTIEKKYTLITGGTSGIGFELAKIFAREGFNLILVARDKTGLDKAQQELSALGADVITISKDLFDAKAPFQLYEEVQNRDLVVSILVNNAGQGVYGEFEDTNIERELDIIQLNISSLVVLTKLFLEDMLDRGEGKILNTSSIASKVPGPFQSVYNSTKAFVQSFSQALRNEVKDKGIVITTLLPGATDTDFFNKADMLDSKAVQDKDQLADPADVAKDGYDALMKGDDMVISGFKNKVQVAMSAILPDTAVAAKVHKQQEPVDKKE